MWKKPPAPKLNAYLPVWTREEGKRQEGGVREGRAERTREGERRIEKENEEKYE